MDANLMNDFEELEGLGSEEISDELLNIDNDDDDPSFRPG